MAQSSWPAPAASRVVSDLQYEQLVAAQYVDGQVGSPSDTPLVYADGAGRQVGLRANRTAQLRGHGWTSGTTDVVLLIGANTSGSSRTDLVVLGLNRSTWEVTAYVKAGTPGAGVPALQLDTGTTGIYEMPLAEVTVPVGASVTTADQVKPRAWWTRPNGAASAGVDTRPPNPAPGMTLWETDTAYLWSGTAWERTSNPLLPSDTAQTADMLGSSVIIGDSTWRDVPTATWPSLTFTVPQSGCVAITISAWIENRVVEGATIWLGWRAGGPAGLIPGTLSSVMNERALSTRNGRLVASRRRLFTNLVPGRTGTLIPAYYAAGSSSDGNVTTIRTGQLIVEPIA